jgi:hypothetical protein
MPCGNSSNLNSSKTFVTVNPAAFASSRFAITIPSGDYATGITGGHVIYYDIAGGSYGLAKANSAVKSEVIGIVESYNSIDSSITVITNGSINMPSAGITATSGGGAAGGLDVYFLSDTDAGYIQPLAPSTSGNIIKPIYQVAPHAGAGSSYTGIVTNYIGYSIGNEIETTVGGFAGSVGSLVFTLGTISDPSYVLLNSSSPSYFYPWFPKTAEYQDAKNTIGSLYGMIYRIKLKYANNGQIITQSLVTEETASLGAERVVRYIPSLSESQSDIPEDAGLLDSKWAVSIFGRTSTGALRSSWGQQAPVYGFDDELRKSQLISSGSLGNLKDELQSYGLWDEDYFYFITLASNRSDVVDDPEKDDYVLSPPNTNNGLNDAGTQYYKYLIDTSNVTLGRDKDIVVASRAEIVGYLLPNINADVKISQSLSGGVGGVVGSGALIGPATTFPPNHISKAGGFINVYMKIKETGSITSFAPSTVEIEQLLGNTIKFGESETDLETKIDDLESRIATMESILRIT